MYCSVEKPWEEGMQQRRKEPAQSRSWELHGALETKAEKY